MKKITTKQLVATLLIALSLVFVAKAQSPIYSETFTGSLGTANASNGSNGNWVWSNSCTRSSFPGHSAGGHAYFLGNGSTCQYGDVSGNIVSGNLNTPQISIPPTGAYLTFNYSMANEWGTNGTTGATYDVLKFQISTNGGASFSTIMASDGSTAPLNLTNNNSWVAVSYTLPTAYNGQNIIIRFNFNSGDGAFNNFDGIYIDDINVIGFCTPPIVSLTASSNTVCSGVPFVISAQGTASNYSLVTLGSPSSTVGANSPVTLTLAANASYMALGYSATGCLGISAQKNVAVIQSPTVNVQFAYPSPACLGDDVVISVNGASNYTLEPGTYISSSSLFTLTPYGTTQYSIVGTNTANCLSANTAIAQVSVNPRPEILVNSGSICAGDGFTMYPIGGVNYTYTGSGGSASVNPPAGVYSYTVNSIVDGCAGIPAVSHLTVYTMPNIVAMASPANVCRVGGDVESIDLTATGADNFLWSTGETLANLSVNARTIGLGTIVFSVTGTSNDGGGCSKTATVSVNVSLCLGVDNLSNESEEINVYPNPSKGEFILKTEKTISAVVYDLQGKSVLKQDLQEGVHIIHLNEQGSGHYFLKAVSDDGKQLRKVLIKE